MTKPIITVKQDHIMNSTREDTSHCMIADAIKESLPWARYVKIDVQTIRISDPANSRRIIYYTPRRVQMALLDFDRGNPVAPFSFSLRKPRIEPMRRGDANKNSAGKGRKKLTEAALAKKKTLKGKIVPAYKRGSQRAFGLRAESP